MKLLAAAVLLFAACASNRGCTGQGGPCKDSSGDCSGGLQCDITAACDGQPGCEGTCRILCGDRNAAGMCSVSADCPAGMSCELNDVYPCVCRPDAG